MAIDPKNKSRYYFSERFSQAVIPEVKEAFRLAEDNLFSLRDRQWDVREFTLSGTRIMNINTIVGKPLLTILIQDVVGGWAVSWPTKFRGTSVFVFDLTPNTYTSILWYPVAEDKVLLIAGSSGVPL